MTELELLVDFHKNTKRQGPGSTKETIRALELTELSKSDNLKIVDIGCGSGGQTITLAQHLEGEITAVDLFPQFLDELKVKSEKLGLQHKIRTLCQSMDDLPFENEEFDLIWSEGAIYSMGFEAGIKNWRKFLKTGGHLAVSEITWLTNSRPREIEEYWQKEYPEIDTAAGKIRILEQNGYSLVGYFVLSPDSWLKNYYQPMEENFSVFLEKHHHSASANRVVEEHQEEIRLYQKFKDYYSYGFYIAQKV
jgi:ubiquinone/menaquinone biosynthesis C-methylase UbiE